VITSLSLSIQKYFKNILKKLKSKKIHIFYIFDIFVDDVSHEFIEIDDTMSNIGTTLNNNHFIENRKLKNSKMLDKTIPCIF
jgi:hypothetical protein